MKAGQGRRFLDAAIWRRVFEDPWGFIVRGFRKTVLGPLKYGSVDGYDAARYWEDRFRRYGLSLRGPGHEGLTERRNVELYGLAVQTLRSFCMMNQIDLKNSKVLEVGCGTGVWTEVCRSEGTSDYTGVDITDVLLPTLRARYPEYRFLKADITAGPLTEQYDVVLMIDVIEHIVQEETLTRAMKNVRDALRPGGTFVIAFPGPENQDGPKKLFYLRFWPQSSIKAYFPAFTATQAVPFRYGELLALRAQQASDGMSG
jgi:SAM-dependent methyltransferase